MVLFTQPEVWLLAGQDGQGEQTTDHIYCGATGILQCERMPFRLTNAPATFQPLMETWLRNLSLNWCIIFLDDIVIFQKIQQATLRGWRPCSRNWNRLG